MKMGLYITDNPNKNRTLLDGLFSIAMFIPSVSVSVGRIHNIGLSNWRGWLFMLLALPMMICSIYAE